MFNLLSLKEQQRIRDEYKIRLLITFLYFVMATIFTALIFATPSYLLSAIKEKDAKNQLILAVKAAQSENQNDFSSIIKETNKKISLLKLNVSTPASDLFTAVISHKTSNIKVKSVAFSSGGDKAKNQSLFVSGTAVNRESLASFAKDLKGDSHFLDVVLPVSDLAKDKDIDFSITISVK